jgi:hypothetical protein
MRAGMGAELCQAADDVLVVSRTKRGRKGSVALPDLLDDHFSQRTNQCISDCYAR